MLVSLNTQVTGNYDLAKSTDYMRTFSAVITDVEN